MVSKMKGILKDFCDKGAFHIFAGSFVTKFVAFFSSIFLVRVLDKNDYGVLSYIDNIYSYFYVLAGMGLANALFRYVVLGKTNDEKYTYYCYAIIRGTWFNTALLAVGFAFCILYPHPESFYPYRWLMVAMLIVIPFMYIVDGSMNTARAMFDTKRYAYIAFMTATLFVVFRFVGAWAFDLMGLVVGAITISILLSIYLIYVTRRVYFESAQCVKILSNTKKSMNNYAFQYMITNGLWAIFMLNDIFLLGQLGGDPSILADYKVAYVLPANLAIISTSIGVFVGPYFTKHEHDGDIDWVKSNYIKTLLATALLIGVAVLILYVFARPIIVLLYGIQYENIVPIMRVLLVAAFINCGLRYSSATVLAAMGIIKYNMLVSFTGVILQIIANIIVIPKYGAIGVAWTSVSVYAVMAFVLFLVVLKRFFISPYRR